MVGVTPSAEGQTELLGRGTGLGEAVATAGVRATAINIPTPPKGKDPARLGPGCSLLHLSTLQWPNLKYGWTCQVLDLKQAIVECHAFVEFLIKSGQNKCLLLRQASITLGLRCINRLAVATAVAEIS